MACLTKGQFPAAYQNVYDNRVCKFPVKGSEALIQILATYAPLSPESQGVVSCPCCRGGQNNSTNCSFCTGGISQPLDPSAFLRWKPELESKGFGAEAQG